MSNFTDQYAYGYRYLINVFTGTLQPSKGGSAAQPGVAYRKLAMSRNNVEWAASIGLKAELQTFEIWAATLTAGTVPGINDVWTDAAGVKWNVVKVDADPLANSSGVPTRFFVIGQRPK